MPRPSQPVPLLLPAVPPSVPQVHDAVYHANAHVLLQGDACFRFERLLDRSLTVQLMDADKMDAPPGGWAGRRLAGWVAGWVGGFAREGGCWGWAGCLTGMACRGAVCFKGRRGHPGMALCHQGQPAHKP